MKEELNSAALAEYYAKEKDELNALYYLEQSLVKGELKYDEAELKLEDVLENELWYFLKDNFYFKKFIERHRKDKAHRLDYPSKENIKVLDFTRERYLSFKMYPTISEFINLEELILDKYDFLNKFPSEFLNLHKIEKISIKKCRYLVTEGLEYFPKLISLNCSGINLKGNWTQTGNESRFKYIVQCKALKELNLEDCELDELSEDICKLENLEILNLNKNRLRKLPKFFTQLQKLKKLSIVNTTIKTIEEEILFMPQLQELRVGNMLVPKDEKEALDKLFQKKIKECPYFKTDYFGDLPVEIEFSPGIQIQLDRLKVPKVKNVPQCGFKMTINNEDVHDIPLELVQILWGYDWGKIKFRFTKEGKEFYGIDKSEDARVIMTVDKYESTSRYLEGIPYLCFGKITGVKSMTKLLFDLKDWYVYDPRVVVVIPDDPFGDGSLEEFSKFLSFLERV
jgi:hypothetical protein